VDQSASYEAKRSTYNQEILRILWNSKVHYHFYKSPIHTPLIEQSSPFYVLVPYILNIHFNIILSSTSAFHVVHFTQVSPTKNLYIPLLSSIRATCCAHQIRLQLITRIFDEVNRSLSSFPVTPTLLSPSTFLSTQFSSTLNLRCLLDIRDQDSLSYKTTGDIKYRRVFIFAYFDNKREDNVFWTKSYRRFPEFKQLWIYICMLFWYFWFVP